MNKTLQFIWRRKWAVLPAGFFTLLGLLVSAAAFEAHVINITAYIENALAVSPMEITYGTVFPQEKLDKTFSVALSDGFLSQPIGTQYAVSVTSSVQGLRKNGTAVLPDRSDPAEALGPPESTGAEFDSPVVAGSFFSMGFGGMITLEFEHFIINATGSDIAVFEVTGGTSYPEEKVKVEASRDGSSWTDLGMLARDGSVDLGAFDWAKFVRLTDVSDPAIFEDEADGYDLDAVRAYSRPWVGEVEYAIRQKPKCIDSGGNHPQVAENPDGTFSCPQGSTVMPLLCPYVSKHEITGDPGGEDENDGAGINAFHGLPGPWTVATAVGTQVEGVLSDPADDISDIWNIDLRVPCFKGNCDQGWAEFVKAESGDSEIDPDLYKANSAFEHEIFGCDLWVEIIHLH